jgi:hypothetical protein
MVVSYLVIGGSFIAESNSSGGLAERLVAGALAAAALLAVLAAVTCGWQRWRRSQASSSAPGPAPRFRDKPLSAPVVATALALAFLSAVGDQATTHSSGSGAATDTQAAAGTSAPSSTTARRPQERDRDALVAWRTSLPAGERQEVAAFGQLALIRKGLGATHLNLRELVAEARQAHLDATAFVASVGREPATTADVQAVKAVHRREADAFQAATADYLRGLINRDVNLLKRGDSLIAQSLRLNQQDIKQGNALYERLGGAPVFSKRPDFQAFEKAISESQAAAKP